MRTCYILFGGFLLWHPIAAQTPSSFFPVDGFSFFRQSELIFAGRLDHQESFRSPDGRLILTRFIFSVEEVFRGVPSPRIEIVEYGGTVGDITHNVSDSAQYYKNREYLVFVYRDALGQPRTFAGPLGELPILPAPEGGRIVRLAAHHPLRSVLGLRPGGLLEPYQNLRQRLVQTVGELTHEKK